MDKEHTVEVYTYQPTPFAFGGLRREVKTTLEEFEVVNLGKGFKGVVFANSQKKLWHVAEITSGALVGAKPTRGAVLKMVRGDIKKGDKAMMDNQVQASMGKIEHAKELSNDEFFSLFKGK